MDIFIIHRSGDYDSANSFIKDAKTALSIKLSPRMLKNSSAPNWKSHAEGEIRSCELVLVYDTKQCSESENTLWEIEVAEKLSKPIVRYDRTIGKDNCFQDLKLAYNFEEEFEECFVSDEGKSEDRFLLFKTMLETSEELIRRRQITNGFFITIIGGLLAGSGFLLKENIVADRSSWLLLVPIMLGLLLCMSWWNLLDNYGKLNRAKFKVINRLERQLSCQIFSAEWIALGKGVRKEKYRSFTDTEKRVPLLFGLLLLVVALVIGFEKFSGFLVAYNLNTSQVSHPP